MSGGPVFVERLECVCGWSGEGGDRWIDSLDAHRLTLEHALRSVEAEDRRFVTDWQEVEG